VHDIILEHQIVLKQAQNFYINYISNFIDQENGKIWLEGLNSYDVKKTKDIGAYIELLKVYKINF
jgi:hypothetical protein